jgi:hypothetical protein
LGDAGGNIGLQRLAQHFLALPAWPQFLGLFPDPLSLLGEPFDQGTVCTNRRRSMESLQKSNCENENTARRRFGSFIWSVFAKADRSASQPWARYRFSVEFLRHLRETAPGGLWLGPQPDRRVFLRFVSVEAGGQSNPRRGTFVPMRWRPEDGLFAPCLEPQLD